MWIVRLALRRPYTFVGLALLIAARGGAPMGTVALPPRRPYTFVVLALLIAVLGVAAIVTMPVDIFPAINIPVVTVIWNYSGLSPTEMQNRIITITERAFTTTVNGIEPIESGPPRG